MDVMVINICFGSLLRAGASAPLCLRVWRRVRERELCAGRGDVTSTAQRGSEARDLG